MDCFFFAELFCLGAERRHRRRKKQTDPRKLNLCSSSYYLRDLAPLPAPLILLCR